MMISPMLCQPIEANTLALYKSDDWYAEPKLDGERIIAVRQGDNIQMWTRRGKEVSRKFPEVKIALLFLTPKEWVLDGELTVVGGFTKLLKRNTENKTDIAIYKVKYPATYNIFDVLSIGTEDIGRLPLVQRKQRLLSLFPRDELIAGYVKDAVKLVPTMYGTTMYELFLAMLEAGYEGVVIKRKDSTYQYNRRSNDWLKVKRKDTVDVEVIGLTVSEAGQPFGALVLARNGHYYGKVGTGFTMKDRQDFFEMLAKQKDDTTIQLPSEVKRELLFTTKPIPCEVSVQEHFADGTPRHPSFKRWRMT